MKPKDQKADISEREQTEDEKPAKEFIWETPLLFELEANEAEGGVEGKPEHDIGRLS